MYYPLATTQQTPIYLTPNTTATTTWPTNLLSNMTNVTGPTTNTTLYELPGATAIFDTTAASLTNVNSPNTTGAQIYWSSFN